MKRQMRAWRDRSSHPPPPLSVAIILTNRCNMNCVSCWSYSALREEKPEINWRRQELDYSLVHHFLAELASFGVGRVIFTGGGDPLMHPRFYEIARETARLGLKTTLISNLSLVRPEREAEFINLPLDTIMANFSAGDEASYLAFHPNREPGDFGRLCRLLSKKAATGKTEIKLVFVVCSVNWRSVGAPGGFLDLVTEWGYSVQFKLMSPSDFNRQLIPPPEELAEINRRLPDWERRLSPHGINHNLPVFASQVAARLPGGSREDPVGRFGAVATTGCYAGYLYGRLAAGGHLRFCCNPHPDLGPAKYNPDEPGGDFVSVWRGRAYNHLRERMFRKEFFPGCANCGKLDLNKKAATWLRNHPKGGTGD